MLEPLCSASLVWGEEQWAGCRGDELVFWAQPFLVRGLSGDGVESPTQSHVLTTAPLFPWADPVALP